MRERKLCHEFRITPELQQAGYLRPVRFGSKIDDTPLRRVPEQPVDRLSERVVMVVAQQWVERESLAVRPEAVKLQPVRPRCEKDVPHHAGKTEEFAHAPVRKPEHVRIV